MASRKPRPVWIHVIGHHFVSTPFSGTVTFYTNKAEADFMRPEGAEVVRYIPAPPKKRSKRNARTKK
jgi:hypothetical protein